MYVRFKFKVHHPPVGQGGDFAFLEKIFSDVPGWGFDVHDDELKKVVMYQLPSPQGVARLEFGRHITNNILFSAR